MRFSMRYVVETKSGCFYYRRNGRYWGRLPGRPGSVEFARTYDHIHKGFQQDGRTPTLPGTFAALVEEYLASAEFRNDLEPKTQGAYRGDLDVLREILGREIRPQQVTVSHALKIRGLFADKPGKANMLMRTLRALYAWGKPRWGLKDNPGDLKSANVKALKLGEHQPWTPEALETFRANGRPHLVLAMELGLWLGQRQSDLIQIRWNQILDGMLYVRQKKTDKEVYMPLPAPLVAVLDQAPQVAVTVLVNSKGRPWAKANPLAQAFGDELKQLGLDGFVFHGLRKTSAVAYAMAGCSTKEIASITGQSDQMVAFYTKGVDQVELARSAVSKLEHRQNGKAGKVLTEGRKKC